MEVRPLQWGGHSRGIANGSYSTAMGYDTDANGDGSTAMGQYSEANGKFSTAMGYSSKANDTLH